ncbi:substrate-binding periplasmic protein [Pseudomonas benzenivorans]|uniref:ABC transporter substrate-binding protein n=1 Tax=Pseudomonas benzenivorans TaxID=556533 RepID=A0ABY5H1A6_9PSED|nr:ABC transporter substrate-binding protein [Pseudomonas benzenivorans]UTW06046.1 ABC transporter substrate-binding protein [Pseudomonas benzenivorans]
MIRTSRFGWLVLLLCLVARAEANDLRLVTGDGYAPFTSKELPGGGLLAQVVEQALGQAHVASSLDWLPWSRGLRMTQQGKYDATFPYIRTEALGEQFLFSEPLMVVRQHLFSLAGRAYEVDDLSTLSGRRLCYPLGWQLPTAIQAMVEQGRLLRHAPKGLNECARLLLLGRDDFFIANGPIGAAALAATGQPASRFRRSRSSFGEISLHVIVSRAHPRAEQLMQTINLSLLQFRGSDRHLRLLDAYLEARDRQAQR